MFIITKLSFNYYGVSGRKAAMHNILPESAGCLVSVGGDVVVLTFSLLAYGTIFYDHVLA